MAGEYRTAITTEGTLERRVQDRVSVLALQVEEEIDRVIDQACQSAAMRDAARYAALNGGKRLRPALTLLCAKACGGTEADALPAAAAVELVHAFSLVHDDLPCMDDDDLRRGRPTLHVHAGEATALLAGDAMLNAAYWALATRVPDATIASNQIRELAGACARMIDGQALDTLGGFDKVLSTDEARLRRIHQWKTGALLSAACRMGAISARASDTHLAAISDYALSLGLMFQVVDDLIDVEQPTEQAGKRTGKDADAGKLTFPGVLGVEASRAEVGRLLDKSLCSLEPLEQSGGDLADLARVLASRTR
ncbi:MAG: polyprenyl synthetase family protein [Phycisphaeraceae bacterium]|nr:polyprenyl synthetase family protein [Phycisphaeraceae bacterium]